MENSLTKVLIDTTPNSWKRFSIIVLRLIILFFIILVVPACLLLNYFNRFNSVEKIEIAGNSISFSSKNKDIYYYLFPTSELWANPNIKFDKGDVITIHATGKYNPALHHLVDYAKSDTGRVFPWLGPEGMSGDKLVRKTERLRLASCPLKSANYGALLVRQNISGTDETKIFAFKDERGLDIKFEDAGTISFCVNEMILNNSDTMKNLYLITKDEDFDYEKKRPIAEQKKAWEKIKKEGTAEHLWVDDNIGELLIVIEKIKS